jgi:alanine-glyoxylate transaminase/serine-glyoxylate transaminase/serine-pyruvate transaminase
MQALAKPTLGHLDPDFLKIMDEVRTMLRRVFQTKSETCMPMSGTGSGGMQTCVDNLVEPGDRVMVAVIGYFGGRIAEMARRAGGDVTVVEGEWGRAIDVDELRKAAAGKRYKVLCAVHAETSTGVLQPVAPLRALADELGALLLIDCVTSLGGLEMRFDEWGIDAAYSGTQKCISCPPGLSPVALSTRAREALGARKKPVQSWYFDLSLVQTYWGAERAYHHTAPINMVYALHEGLRLVLEEGFPAREARHRLNGRAFVAGVQAMGLEPRVPEAERLPQLTAVGVPAGIDDARARKHLLERFGVEIGGGLGPMKGNTWRIGLMGSGSTRRNVSLCLAGLASALREQGFRAKGDPLEAAGAVYSA